MERVYHRYIPNSTTKICSKCERVKPLNLFPKDNARKLGYASQCKMCACARENARKNANKPIVQLALPFFKRCYKCKEVKPIENFPPDKTKGDGLGSSCHKCRNDYKKKNRERYNEKDRERHRNNPEYNPQYYIQHRERILERNCKWIKSHPLNIAMRNARRQAHKHRAWAETVDYDLILERDGYFCHICQKAIDTGKIEYDHVIPLSRGGSHTEANIKIAHMSCNRRKKDKLLEEMTNRQRYGV